MSNRTLLSAIVILLVGILGVLIYQMNRTSEPERLAGSVNQVVEEISDEIDDHTTAR